MKHLISTLRVIVAFILMFLLLSRVHARAVIASLAGIDPLFIIPLLGISAVMVGISCLKWQLFLKSRQLTVPLLSLINYYLIGYFFNNLLPGSIGGDVLRGYLLGKDRTGHLQSFTSVFLERLTGLVALLCIGITALIFNMKLVGEPGIVISIGLMALLFAALISFFVFPGSRTVTLKILDHLPPRWASWSAKHFSRFYDSIAYFKNHRKILSYSMVYSFGFQIMAVVNTLVCCWALGLRPKVVDVAVVVPIIMLVSIAPISISSLGLWEGAFAYFFVSIGIAPPHAVSVALILRAKNIVLGIFGGVLFAFRRKASAAPRHF
ncbi:MAG: lysylphosphatidylglycerol synthase transmembrane domain-containing protein [Desulfosoma sp.]